MGDRGISVVRGLPTPGDHGLDDVVEIAYDPMSPSRACLAGSAGEAEERDRSLWGFGYLIMILFIGALVESGGA